MNRERPWFSPRLRAYRETTCRHRWWTMSQTRAAVALVPRKAAEPDVIGVVIGVEPAYPREVGIGWPVLLPILLGAGVVRLLAVLMAAVLRQGTSSGGAPRTPKELRRGAAVLVARVTPPGPG